MPSEAMLAPAPQTNAADRWIVVHDAWRDHYQLPGAFAEAGSLERFVTDWYTPLDRPLWKALVRSLDGNAPFGLSRRFSPLLSSALVADGKLGFLLALLRRRLAGAPFNDVVAGAKGGRRAARLAAAAGAHVLAASYSAAEAFTRSNSGRANVLFQVHPQPRFLRTLYTETMETDPDFDALRHEAEFQVDEPAMQSWEREAQLADHILCASSFSKRSLLWSGIPEDRISVVPYGVDTSLFRPGDPPAGQTFKVLFVGQRVARKSIKLLLRVWARLRPQNAELILAGGHQTHDGVLDEFKGTYTDVPRVDAPSLVELYRQADLFVMPSLAEGFGHAYLEALACGTPVICTDNTGAADLVTPGKDGWILPPGDASALEDLLSWALLHREQVREMRSAARALAERFTWERFRSDLRTQAEIAAARVQAAALQPASQAHLQPVLCEEGA